MATVTVEGTMGAAWAAVALFKFDKEAVISTGSWGQPVIVRNIPKADAQAFLELIQEHGFKGKVTDT